MCCTLWVAVGSFCNIFTGEISFTFIPSNSFLMHKENRLEIQCDFLKLTSKNDCPLQVVIGRKRPVREAEGGWNTHKCQGCQRPQKANDGQTKDKQFPAFAPDVREFIQDSCNHSLQSCKLKSVEKSLENRGQCYLLERLSAWRSFTALKQWYFVLLYSWCGVF